MTASLPNLSFEPDSAQVAEPLRAGERQLDREDDGDEEEQPHQEHVRRDEIELQLENARLLGEQGRAWAALAYLLPHEENTP